MRFAAVFAQSWGLQYQLGVSYNKIFAKLGSDMKKPDATTVISQENYREVVWTQPVSDLLYVGPATTAKLARYGIHTIGALANADVHFLHRLLGKNGLMLHGFANGKDSSLVHTYYMGLRAASWATIAIANDWLVETLFDDLPKVHVPTLILHGVHDQVCPFALGEAQHRGIKNSKLIPFEHSGHGLFYDEMEKFNHELMHFAR